MDLGARDGVRLRYSGFIVFLSRLISVGTGLLFVLIVTRSISVEEFGIFGNTGDTLDYFTLAAAIMPFWTTRFLARKHPDTSKTGLTANLIMSVIFSLLYLSLFSTVMSVLHIDGAYRIVYGILTFRVIETYAMSELEAILQVRQPHLIGYGFLVFETCKVAAGFLLIVQLKLGLLGAVCSIVSAYIAQIAFYLRFVSHELTGRVKWGYVKEWLKASPVNIYGIVGQKLASFVLILLFLHGGELARAYYGAASTIASIIGYSSLLAFALYPSLLSGSNPEDASVSLRMVSMFAVPMTLGAVILSDSYLTILSPTYRIARPVLILLSISNACSSISYVFGLVVLGTERFDAEARIALKELVKSKFFLIYSLPYIESAFAISVTYVTLTTVVEAAIDAAAALALINLVVSITMLLTRYFIAKKCIRFTVSGVSLTKYALASSVMAVTLYLFPSPARLSATLGLTLLGGTIYFLVLSTIDRETRDTIRSAKQTFLSSFSRQPKN